MSIRQKVFPTPSRTAYLSFPSELHPFIQYAASSTSTWCFFAPLRRHVTRDLASFDSKSFPISFRSFFESAQNLRPRGMVGRTSSILSRARCRHSRERASFSTRRMGLPDFVGIGSFLLPGLSASEYPAISCSSIRAVRSEEQHV